MLDVLACAKRAASCVPGVEATVDAQPMRSSNPAAMRYRRRTSKSSRAFFLARRVI
jgi:hypothetical protein